MYKHDRRRTRPSELLTGVKVESVTQSSEFGQEE